MENLVLYPCNKADSLYIIPLIIASLQIQHAALKKQ